MILTIGDLHVKTKTLATSRKLFDAILDTIRQHGDAIRIVVLLGDLLHDHERINTQCMNLVLEFVQRLQDQDLRVVILVGNHDMINPTEFLTDNHWLSVLKNRPGVFVVDRPRVFVNKAGDPLFVACPYVPPGRFIEALDTLKTFDWRAKAPVIFAHQEFRGWNNGLTDVGDEWPATFPLVVSGHIHSKMWLGDNVYYCGTPAQTGFGESLAGGPKTIFLFPDRRELAVDGMPLYLTHHVDASLKDFDPKTVAGDGNFHRVVFTGDRLACITERKSKAYTGLRGLGIRIEFKKEAAAAAEAVVDAENDITALLTALVHKEKNLTDAQRRRVLELLLPSA